MTIESGDTYSATQTFSMDTILQIAWETLPEEWYEKLEERLKELKKEIEVPAWMTIKAEGIV